MTEMIMRYHALHFSPVLVGKHQNTHSHVLLVYYELNLLRLVAVRCLKRSA